MPHNNVIYRLPPNKKYPKGLRVFKSSNLEDFCPITGQLVCAVKDGHMFFTKEKLTKE